MNIMRVTTLSKELHVYHVYLLLGNYISERAIGLYIRQVAFFKPATIKQHGYEYACTKINNLQ